MQAELLRALLTIGFGAMAGGLTNTVAVWMLFHPYEPPKLGPWRLRFLHGAIPKNQGRLAEAVGRTVGGRLLTEEDLTRTLGAPEFRAAFDARLGGLLNEALLTERPSLRELLPDRAAPQVESALEDVMQVAVERLEAYLHSPRFEEHLTARAQELVESLRDEPIGNLLTPDREERVTEAVDEWIVSAVESEGFRRAVDESLDRAARRVLRPGRTFQEVLPPEMVSSVERAVAEYLPLAIQRLGGLLEDPVARARFEAAIHDLLQRFLHDLRFHQRVMARLIITEETVNRVLETVEEEGAEHLSDMLRDPAVQDAMARGVNDAVVDFLGRPVTSVFGEPDSPNVAEVREKVSEWFVGAAQDPATRKYILGKLHAAMDRTAGYTWGQLFDKVPPEVLARWVVQLARSDAGSRLYREVGSRLARSLMDRPIGRPMDWLPDRAPERIQGALSQPLWDWLQSQAPEVVGRMDVAGRVEAKVRGYPTDRMEELVRRVTERELRLIIRLGYVLGAVIGGVLLGVNALIG